MRLKKSKRVIKNYPPQVYILVSIILIVCLGALYIIINQSSTTGNFFSKSSDYVNSGYGKLIEYITPRASLGGGNVYYVSTSGSDSNSGTASSPWRTIQKAANTVVAGDTVIVNEGTYAERPTESTSGTSASNMITYQVNPDNVVIIQGFVLSGSWIKIDGFEITDTASDWDGAVQITGSHCTVTNCNLHDLGRQGIKVGGADYVTISNNMIARCNVNAIVLESGSDYTTIDNNDISDVLPYFFNDANGIFFYPGSYHTISRNYIHDFSFHGKSPHIDAFQISDAGGVTNCVFERNYVDMLIWQNTDEYGKAFEGGGLRYSTIKNNIFRVHIGLGMWGDAGINSDLTIVNNIFIGDLNPPCNVGSSCWPRALALNNVANCVIKNNIAVDFPYQHFNLYGNTPSTVTIDYNNFWNSDGSSINSYTKQANDLWAVDPKFVSLAGKDYHLQSSSPAIDAGTTISSVTNDYDGNSRPQGAAYDIGAYEYFSTCTDECTSSGLSECTSSTSYRTCGNYDVDSCLEWSSATSCSSRQMCSSGQCASSGPKTYYVSSSDGNDSDSGLTEELAWQTLGKVNTEVDAGTFSAGDFIKFKRGDTWTGVLNLDKSGGFGGSKGSPITFEDYGSGNLPLITMNGWVGIDITNDATYLTIKNIKVVGPGSGENYGFDISDASYITVDGCDVSGTLVAIHVHNKMSLGNYATHHITIQNCAITGRREGLYVKHFLGPTASQYTSDVSLLNNTITGVPEAIQVSHELAGAAPANMIVRGNLIYDCNYATGVDWSTVVIDFGGDNYIFEDNIIHDCSPNPGAGVLQICSIGATGKTAHIRNNVVYDITGSMAWVTNAQGTINIYHNTFYSGNEKGFEFVGGYPRSGFVMENNIFSNIAGNPIDSTSGITCDYNVKYGSGSSTCTGANDRTGDPKFVSVTEGSEEFHLQSGSSAIDNGINVGISDDIEGNTRPQGTAYDIGAYESPQTAGAKTYYVSTTGIDSNPGTEAQPWKTIQKAANTLVAGETVIVKAGTYNERVTESTLGTSGSLITYQVNPGDAVTVNGGFTISGNYIKIGGFRITGASGCGWGAADYGIGITGDYVTVENCYTYGNNRGGVYTDYGTEYATIRNCESYQDYGTGMMIIGANHLIENNEVHGVICGGPCSHGDSDGFYYRGSGHIFRSNYIHDIDGGGTCLPHADAFQTDGYLAQASNIIFEKNYIDNYAWWGMNEYTKGWEIEGLKDSTIKNNVVIAHVGIGSWAGTGTHKNENLNIVHNTFIGNLNPGCAVGSDCWPSGIVLAGTPDCTVENNILVDWDSRHISIDSASESGLRIDYNLVYNTDGTDPSCSGSSRGHCKNPHDLYKFDPQFLSPIAGDFHLQSTSPAIDAGTNVGVSEDIEGNKRPQGSAYDIGAYEYTGTTSGPKTYYVSTSGSDSNNGLSQSTPWKTIAKVNSRTFSPGDSILFKRGDTWINEPLIVPSSGTQGNPITFGDYGSGNLPKLDGNNQEHWAGLVRVDGKSWVTIENLEITNVGKECLSINSRSGPSTGVTVRNCIIHKNSYAGFMLVTVLAMNVQGSVSNVLFTGNTLYDTQWNTIRVTGGVTDSTFSNNEFYGCPNHGAFDTYNREARNKNLTIISNKMHDCNSGIYITGVEDSTISDNDIYNMYEFGIKVEPCTDYQPFGPAPRNNIVMRNRIWAISGYGIWVTNTEGAINFWHNTIYNCDNTLLSMNNPDLKNNNNLAYACTSDVPALRNYYSNPSFVNPTATPPDFHLQSTSPAIDKGVNVGLPYSGAAPDLGAYEYTGAGPKTYYVSTGGSDSNPGTHSQPWRTIQKAANMVVAGDTVIVNSGVYNERVTVSRSGNSSAMIAFVASGTVNTYGFYITGNYIRLDGFTATAQVCSWNQDSIGIYVEGDNCIIENNYAYYSPRGGIKLGSASSDCTVRNNRCNRNGMVGIEVHGTNHLVEKNDISGSVAYHTPTGCSGDADGLRFWGSGHIIRGNYIHNIDINDPENQNYGPHIDCFQTWQSGNEFASNIIFERNICENNNLMMYAGMIEGSSYLTFKNNIFKGYAGLNVNPSMGKNDHLIFVNNDCIANLSILKCTVGSNCWPSGLALQDAPYSTVKNNIFYDYRYEAYSITGTSATGLDAGYNIAYQTDGKSPSGTPRVHDLWGVDPKFVNPAGNDFHLQVISPAIDNGTIVSSVTTDYDGVSRPQGSAYDIGAYEHGGPSCTNECTSSGLSECTSSTSYRTCGNYDADSCLEWSSSANCNSGETCSAGQCQLPSQTCSSIGGSCCSSCQSDPHPEYDSDCGVQVCCDTCATQQYFLPEEYVEAEDGTLVSPMSVGFDSLASEGMYVSTSVEEQGSVSFTFDIQEGRGYRMDVRVLAQNDGQNSFYIGLDNESVQGSDAYVFDTVETNVFTWDSVSLRGPGGDYTWSEFDPMVWDLSPGLYTFTFYGREVATLLDQVVLRPVGGMLPTCFGLGGFVCSESEFCPGVNLSASDTLRCCSLGCVVPSWGLCSECGMGLFNVCDDVECYSITEGCYFVDGLLANSCLSCSGVSCEDYSDETSCVRNNCKFVGCAWDGGKCVSCVDNDNDGYNQTKVGCGLPDCNDADPNIRPGVVEICNGVDDNCNGMGDETYTTYYQDLDGDGYGSLLITKKACSLPNGYVTKSNDCNDNNKDIHPGVTEKCGDNIDYDCDGFDSNGYDVGADCGVGDCLGKLVCSGLYSTACSSQGKDCGVCCSCNSAGSETYGGDQDADCAATVCSTSSCGLSCGANIFTFYPLNVANTCSALKTCTNNSCISTCEIDKDNDKYSPTCGDCNDNNPKVHPPDINEKSSGLCNGIDDDCDNKSDEGCACIYGQTQSCGTSSCVGTQTCDASGNWGACSSQGKDCGVCCSCNSAGSETYGGDQDADCAATVCSTSSCDLSCGVNVFTLYPVSVPNVCSALKMCTSNVCGPTCEVDGDGDGYSVSCGDCNDADPNINPGATELCNNVDDNCNDQIDEGLVRSCSISHYGICADGNEACVDGKWSDCPWPKQEIYCNGVDEDCDNVDDCLSCSQQGGDICSSGEFCPGVGLVASDSSSCCSEQCSLSLWGLCSECGMGLFNVCDDVECYSITGGCYFVDGLLANSCLSCSGITCQDYTDRTVCGIDNCGLGCFWKGNSCLALDKTPPIISSVQSSDITYDSAEITWVTDEPSTSQVEYGLTTSYTLKTKGGNKLVTSHSVKLTNLETSKNYHFMVRSVDESGNEEASDDYDFVTACIDKDKDGYDDMLCGGTDCDDKNRKINPSATESCNDIDDDCDGYIDEDVAGCYGSIIIKTNFYDGSTTDFSKENLSEGIKDMLLEKKEYGKIVFNKFVKFTKSLDLDYYTMIYFNKIFINSTALPELNESATLHIYNLSFVNPIIYKDGSPCPSNICKVINYSEGTLIFEVDHFTEYYVEEGHYCGDGTCKNDENCNACPQDCGQCQQQPSGGGGGGGSGGGGSSMGISPTGLKETLTIVGSKAGASYSFDFTKPGDVKSVILSFKNNAGSSSVTIEKFEVKPSLLPLPKAKVYSYLEITTNVNKEDISKVLIVFRVPRLWLIENGVLFNEVSLLKFEEGWAALPTTVTTYDKDYYYYEAESEGLSYFSISVKVKEESLTVPSVRNEEETPAPEDGSESPQVKEIDERDRHLITKTAVVALAIFVLIALVVFFLLKSKPPKQKLVLKGDAHKSAFINDLIRRKLKENYTEKAIIDVASKQGWPKELIKKTIDKVKKDKK